MRPLGHFYQASYAQMLLLSHLFSLFISENFFSLKCPPNAQTRHGTISLILLGKIGTALSRRSINNKASVFMVKALLWGLVTFVKHLCEAW